MNIPDPLFLATACSLDNAIIYKILPITARNTDRLYNIARQITKTVKLTLQIGKYCKIRTFLVLELKEDIILEINCLQEYNPTIDWRCKHLVLDRYLDACYSKDEE